VITEYQVAGMTCEHCRHHVIEEVSSVPGVEAVSVDLATGSMTVTSTAPVPFAALEAAVREAGDYRVRAPM